MQQNVVKFEASPSDKHRRQAHALQTRADEVLIAIAVLGLVASVVDGNADVREISRFTDEFRRRFALSRRHSLKLIGIALRRIRIANGTNIIDCACDTLNEHLDSSQRLGLFEALAEILVADGAIHEGEEFFFDYVAVRLNLLESLDRLCE